MDISPSIRILGTIKTGSIYYFAEEKLSSTEPHYFVVLNEDPRTAEILILVCASSQVQKRQQIRKRLGFPEETLVLVSKEECSLFTKDTVIDCNSAFEKTPQSLIDKLEQGKLKVCTEQMSPEIIQKLIKGVLMSIQVSKGVQKMLSSSKQTDEV